MPLHKLYILTLLICISSAIPEKKNIEIEVLPKQESSLLKEELWDGSRYNVGFLIMDGTYNIELTAPYDIYQHTIFREGIKAMNVFTVANTHNPIITFEGMKIIPDFNYVTDSIPSIDVLVVTSAEHHMG